MPVLPSITAFLIPPELVATIGFPQADASRYTIPKPSKFQSIKRGVWT